MLVTFLSPISLAIKYKWSNISELENKEFKLLFITNILIELFFKYIYNLEDFWFHIYKFNNFYLTSGCPAASKGPWVAAL